MAAPKYKKLTFDMIERLLPPREWAAVKPWLLSFHPFQLDWLLDWERFSLLLKCRQIGASHTYAAAAVLWSLLNEDTAIVSVGEREGTDVLDKVRVHCECLVKLGSVWARPKRNAATKIRTAGGTIMALPATSGARGFSGNVILDEFAYHDRPQEVWDGAAGAVTHGFKMRIASTPNGPGNLFHALCTDPRQSKGFVHHRVTLKQAIADGMKIDEEACWRQAHGDQRVFDQLFNCSFLDNDQQLIPQELLEVAMTGEYAPLGGECWAGIDIGRTNDLTALVVVRVDTHGQRWVVHMETRKRTEFADIEYLVDHAVKFWRCRKVAIDATGMGAFPAEQMQVKHGRHRIDAVKFSLESKEKMATTLFQHFVDRRIWIDHEHESLRNDIASIRRIVTNAGNVRYDAPQTMDGHGDRAWALALALQACSGPSRRRHELHDYEEDA